MRLLQLTALFLLLATSLCRGEDSKDVQNSSTPSLAEPSTTKASVTTPGTIPLTNLHRSTGETPTEGMNNSEVSKSPLVPALNLLTTPKHEVKATTDGLLTNEVFTIKTTVPNTSISNAVSTLPNSQHKTENQSSIRTTEISVTTQLPDASPKTTEILSASLTTAKTISQLQDTEDGKIAVTPSTTPSYSSIILPVVIALIVITLLVFTLVGLYRICWKRDPGTPENGNDQPQSDKESVKLLTVKTISHESGFSFSF
ncbi:endomucin isoform X2 [Apodemus sylvaticus]|uniref:endomucin isoform X2 n=1 Tax=Apodemus sylvaticus TaxID=10129 RepID=UPI0022431D51|nr:endomucin isoform X2 [Apodemus sylvaticus]